MPKSKENTAADRVLCFLFFLSLVRSPKVRTLFIQTEFRQKDTSRSDKESGIGRNSDPFRNLCDFIKTP